MPLLKLTDVSKTYPQGGLWRRRKSVQALACIELELERGRCLAVIGPSGSGKSTLGRLVLGLDRPDSGSILYRGKPLPTAKDKTFRAFRRNVQAVFQNSHDAVNPRFPVLEIIGEPLRYLEDRRGKALVDKVAGLLAKVGLPSDVLYKLPHRLSGGELQRVCLARALAPQPELIVLDEAVSSLDMLNQGLVLDLLLGIKKEYDTAFLFISHDLKVVGRIADSIAVIENGQMTGYARDMSDPAQASQLLATVGIRRLAAAVLPSCP